MKKDIVNNKFVLILALLLVMLTLNVLTGSAVTSSPGEVPW